MLQVLVQVVTGGEQVANELKNLGGMVFEDGGAIK
jgi:hypothetical protein